LTSEHTFDEIISAILPLLPHDAMPALSSCVCLSICWSATVGFLPWRLNVVSRKQHHNFLGSTHLPNFKSVFTRYEGMKGDTKCRKVVWDSGTLQFSNAKILSEVPMGSSPAGRQIQEDRWESDCETWQLQLLLISLTSLHVIP